MVRKTPGNLARVPVDRSKLYRDLRVRDERRANLAQLLDAQRRQRIERVLQVARRRGFGKND